MTIVISAYLSYVLVSYSTLLDGSICSDHLAVTFVATHISLLHASMVVHMYNPFLEFHTIIVRARGLLSMLILYDGYSEVIELLCLLNSQNV